MATRLHFARKVMWLDVAIVGGGPAGLSAAPMLGRCRRRVVVCDAGTPRNAAAEALHGYLTRDGMAPADFLAHARCELEPAFEARPITERDRLEPAVPMHVMIDRSGVQHAGG